MEQKIMNVYQAVQIEIYLKVMEFVFQHVLNMFH